MNIFANGAVIIIGSLLYCVKTESIVAKNKGITSSSPLKKNLSFVTQKRFVIHAMKKDFIKYLLVQSWSILFCWYDGSYNTYVG